MPADRQHETPIGRPGQHVAREQPPIPQEVGDIALQRNGLRAQKNAKAANAMTDKSSAMSIFSP